MDSWQALFDWLGVATYIAIRALWAIGALGMLVVSATTLFVLIVWCCGAVWYGLLTWLT